MRNTVVSAFAVLVLTLSMTPICGDEPEETVQTNAAEHSEPKDHGTAAGKKADNSERADHRISAAGWAVMLLSVCSVLGLVTFCLVRVLSLPPVEEESLKGPLEIDTRDTSDAD